MHANRCKYVQASVPAKWSSMHANQCKYVCVHANGLVCKLIGVSLCRRVYLLTGLVCMLMGVNMCRCEEP